MKYRVRVAVALGMLSAVLMGVQNARADASRKCMEYSRNVTIEGWLRQGYGRACREPDGSWAIVKLSGLPEAQVFMRDTIKRDLFEKFPGVWVYDPLDPVYDKEMFLKWCFESKANEVECEKKFHEHYETVEPAAPDKTAGEKEMAASSR